jgi:hypothetical protein
MASHHRIQYGMVPFWVALDGRECGEIAFGQVEICEGTGITDAIFFEVFLLALGFYGIAIDCGH